MPTREFDEKTADQIFNDPFLSSFRMDYNVITQLSQVNNVGVILLIQMLNQSDGDPMDISSADNLEIVIGYPDGTISTKTAGLFNDGIDGKFYYTTVEDDLAVVGDCTLQGKVTIGDNVYYGEVSRFSILSNIIATSSPQPDSHVGTFENGDLDSNVLTINHYKGLDAPYTITVTIFDNDGNQITPDQITGFENKVEIDLTSFSPISGSWGYVYI